MRNFASPVLCALQTRFLDLKKQTVLQSGEKKKVFEQNVTKGSGACFSKSPKTSRARRQILIKTC